MVMSIWMAGENTYIASTDSDVRDSDNNIVRIFDLRNWAVFEPGITWAV
jgi:hypothetical protein